MVDEIIGRTDSVAKRFLATLYPPLSTATVVRYIATWIGGCFVLGGLVGWLTYEDDSDLFAHEIVGPGF